MKSPVTFAGHFRAMENITVNARCNLTIDHHEPTTNVINNLDIKTFGSVNVFTEDEALTTLQGTTLTVRSGAKVSLLTLWNYCIIH